MNIDLFMSKNGRFGLMATQMLKETPAGVLYDAETNELTIEFHNQDPFHCNINVDVDLSEALIECNGFYFAMFDKDKIGETLKLPLMTLNDPHRDDLMKNLSIEEPATRVVKEFDGFIKSSSFAQAVHRDDLSNENDSRSILNGTRTKDLSFTPKLLRHKDMVVALGPEGPQVVPAAAPQAAPQMGGPAPGGPKGSGFGDSRTSPIRRTPPSKKQDESED